MLPDAASNFERQQQQQLGPPLLRSFVISTRSSSPRRSRFDDDSIPNGEQFIKLNCAHSIR